MSSVKQHYTDFAEKRISRNELVRSIRRVAGDELLASVIKSCSAKKPKRGVAGDELLASVIKSCSAKVELLIPQLLYFDDEGAQAEVRELSRVFIDTHIEETRSLSERLNDMFCDDILGASPTEVRKMGKGDGLLVDKSGLKAA